MFIPMENKVKVAYSSFFVLLLFPLLKNKTIEKVWKTEKNLKIMNNQTMKNLTTRNARKRTGEAEETEEHVNAENKKRKEYFKQSGKAIIKFPS